MIQESKLEGHKITPSIGDNFTVIRNDRKDSDGGSLITYTHKNISYIDTTKTTRALLPQQGKTTELQSFKISTGLNKHINLINIYIPPINSVSSGYLPLLHKITQIPDLIMGGDFNGKSTAWYENNITSTRGTYIEHELQHYPYSTT